MPPNLTKLLRVNLREKLGEIVNSKEEYLFPKDKLVSYKADIAIHLAENQRIFIEVEETQSHPDSNVLKYWLYLTRNQNIKVDLIHIFGREFTSTKRNYKSKIKSSRFLARKMQQDLGLRFNYHPKKLLYLPEEYETNTPEIVDKATDFVLGILETI